MSIKLKVKPDDKVRAKGLGALWIPEEKTWVIPDPVKDINSFKEWLPSQEGWIVQRPYFVVRAKRLCHKCGQETPIIGLGAKNAQYLFFEREDRSVWQYSEGPIIFSDTDYLDAEVVASLQEYYPFYRKAYSKVARRKFWGNTCVNCYALQEDDEEFLYEDGNPLSPLTIERAREIRIVYFKLKFDYYIRSSYGHNSWYEDIF